MFKKSFMALFVAASIVAAPAYVVAAPAKPETVDFSDLSVPLITGMASGIIYNQSLGITAPLGVVTPLYVWILCNYVKRAIYDLGRDAQGNNPKGNYLNGIDTLVTLATFLACPLPK